LCSIRHARIRFPTASQRSDRHALNPPVHPQHEASTVDVLKPLVKKVTVYDFGTPQEGAWMVRQSG
jgi:hypothetical protein